MHRVAPPSRWVGLVKDGVLYVGNISVIVRHQQLLPCRKNHSTSHIKPCIIHHTSSQHIIHHIPYTIYHTLPYTIYYHTP
ncbi:hypothetical protein EON63_16395 [archaeon]|nr:MAG: hypothetical protein EON63_16395 [archaeon]